MMAVGTCRTLSVTRKTSQPSAGPAITLPTTANRKVGATAATEKLFAATAPTASRKIRSAVASFSRLSPSRIVRIRCGRLRGRGSARARTAARARGGDSVWRREDCSERERGRPRHRWYERVDDDGDRGGRESDREHDQA